LSPKNAEVGVTLVNWTSNEAPFSVKPTTFPFAIETEMGQG